MPRFSFKMLGMKRAVKKFRGMPRNIRKAIASAVKEGAFIIEKESWIAISTGSTKAIRTGRLRGSIAVQSLRPFRATIYPTANYAIYVHEGTSRMPRRQFMTKGLKQAERQIARIFGNRIRVAIR